MAAYPVEWTEVNLCFSTDNTQQGRRICSPSKQPEEASEATERLIQDFEVSLRKCVRGVELIVLKASSLMKY